MAEVMWRWQRSLAVAITVVRLPGLPMLGDADVSSVSKFLSLLSLVLPWADVCEAGGPLGSGVISLGTRYPSLKRSSGPRAAGCSRLRVQPCHIPAGPSWAPMLRASHLLRAL